MFAFCNQVAATFGFKEWFLINGSHSQTNAMQPDYVEANDPIWDDVMTDKWETPGACAMYADFFIGAVANGFHPCQEECVVVMTILNGSVFIAIYTADI